MFERSSDKLYFGARFDVDVPGGPVLKESNTAAPGRIL